MTKASFIRAVEIWVPTADRTRLSLKAGHYGELDYFARISRGMQFAFEEGLPGKCWASGRPVILKDLANSYFRRGDAAMNVGLTCAVAIPFFTGADLKAVTVLFCGADARQVGAVELWHAEAGEPQMELHDGYFGNAEKFEFSSRHLQFSPGVGLPGMVWSSNLPLIMEDLASSEQFVRRDMADTIGINRAIGFPCTIRGEGNWVLTMLSARNSPIARRMELWRPDLASGLFRFEAGYCESGTDLAAACAGKVVPLDVGPMGESRLGGIPVVAPAAEDPVLGWDADLSASKLILPVYSPEGHTASLAVYL